jgi:DNA polymerase-1
MGKPKTKYHILENEQQLDMLIDACKKTGYASVDFETTGNRIYNNDFYPTILGVCFEPGRAGVIPLGHFDSKFKKSWKTKLQKFGEEVIANENIVKVAWNAKFDMQVFHKYGIFHKGRLFDGMLAKYVLDEAKPNDLKSMVRRFLPKFGDYEEDYEGCNLPWDQKPLLGLSQYCAIDTDMCLRLFLFFEKKMMDKKFYHLFRNLIMPASNLLTKVETRGQRLDKEWHGKLMEEYPRRILEAETKVRALKKVKRFEKSLIQQRLDKAISKIEEEIRESKKVIKTSDDSRKIASAERSIKNREEKIARLMAGEFNTKSEKAIIEPINFGSASQMTQLLFTDPKGFKFPVVKYTQKDKRDTDNPSSSEAVLLELQKTDKTGFIDTLLELRGLKQINNMFVKGFANLVQDDGRLHPKFNIHGTRTGRLSSADPNSQQLPRVATDPTIRRCLVASPGRLYLMMDYSQCELRLMAHLSKCKGLLEAFAKGWDPHLSVACKKYGVNYDDIYPIYKDEQHPEYTTWKIRRKQAKHIVFGCIYHIGAAKLAEELSDPKTGLVVTPKESQGFLDDFFKDFPEVKKFMDNQMKFIHKHGYIKTLFGRKRRCPEIFGDNQMQIVAAENAAINTPSQSAASDMALFTSILIDELIQKGEFPDLQEVGTVHDSIYFDTLPQDINPKTIYQLWDMARNPSTKEWFGFQIDDIDMSMDFEVGRSQGEELPFAVGYDYNRLLNFKGEWKGSKEEEYYFSLVNKCKSVDIKDYPKVYPEYFK